MKGITKYQWCLIAIVGIVFALHLFAIINPYGLYIYDEYFYVPAAKCILNGTICNSEHPPLAKAIIAANMAIFGDNGVGWRLPSVIAGTLSIVVVYLIVRKLHNEKTALLAAFLLCFESLWFTHSSMAMLDIIAVFLGLIAIYLFLLEKYAVSGILLGLAILSKETAILIIPVLVVYSWFIHPKAKLVWKPCLKICLSALIIFIAGLWIYDASIGAYPTPAHHLVDMFRLQGNIEIPNQELAINPGYWFLVFKPAPYLLISSGIKDGAKHVIYQYLGKPNLFVLLAAWISVPFAFILARKGNKLAILNLLFFGIIYAIFLISSIFRVTYPFNMLLLIPSLTILNALLLTKLPKPAVIAYCIGVLAWFVIWFPVNLF